MGENRALRALLGAWLLAAPALAPGQVDEPTPVVVFDVERFEIDGESPLSRRKAQAVLARYLGEHAGVDGLLAAADALEQAIREAGGTFHRVTLPPQQLRDGVVRLKVAALRISGVVVRGNEHFSAENVRRSVPGLEVGEAPDARELGRSLQIANRNPAKQTTLTFRKSEQVPNSLDANLAVEDTKPWMLYASLDNTGTAQTGPFRITAGFQASNLFDRDHVASLSYTSSPGHASRIRQWAGSYQAPLYALGGSISAYYVTSDADTGRLLNVFDVSGSGDFAGVSYTHTFHRRGALTHRVSAGLDDKLFTSNVLFGRVNLAQDVRSRPVSVRYSGEVRGKGWHGDFSLAYVRNIVSGGGNDDDAYRANRGGAEAHWDLVRVGGHVSTTLPGQWGLRGTFEGQFANEALIPGEQFGLGGVRSVRGFDEREVSGDDGQRASLELWGPPLDGTNLRFLFFLDAGRVSQKVPIPGQGRQDGLISAGAGVRWHWKENVSLLLDVGHVVEGTSTRDDGARGHLNLFVRY